MAYRLFQMKPLFSCGGPSWSSKKRGSGARRRPTSRCNQLSDSSLRSQNERLYLLQEALKEREKDIEEKNAQRIEEIKIKKTEQKNRLVAKI